jgi:mannose-6-phosphate isomerase-like protein (cupin superfamily)
MIIKNNGNTPKGEYEGFMTHLLIGRSNVGANRVSIQFTEVAVGGAQFLHTHEPEQCYYIIEGKGRMSVGEEALEVKGGDAVCIPSNSRHGIENIGDCPLTYLTANSPAFDEETEATNWPLGLTQK